MAAISTIISLVITAASMAYQYSQARKQRKEAEKAAEARKGFEFPIEGEVASVPIVYGRAKVGGVRVYHNTSGTYNHVTDNADTVFNLAGASRPAMTITDTYRLGGTEGGEEVTEYIEVPEQVGGSLMGSEVADNNVFLYYDQILCQAPINRVVDLIIDDSRYLDDPALTDIPPQANRFQTSLKAKAGLKVMVHNSGNVADAVMSANFGERNDAIFKDVAYMSCIFKLNRDDPQFSSLPQLQALIEGRKVKSILPPNLDLDGTLADGGFGFQGSVPYVRYPDLPWPLHLYPSLSGTVNSTFTLSSTREYSNNPALCLLDYLMDETCGKGIPLSEIDLPTFYYAYLVCASIVQEDVAVGGSIFQPVSGGGITHRDLPLYECNLIIDTKKPIRENVESLLSTMGDARLVWSGGKYKLILQYPLANEDINVAATLTDDDLVLDQDVEIAWPSSSERLNYCTVRFHNEEQEFKEDTASWPFKTSGTFRRGIGGRKYAPISGWNNEDNGGKLLDSYAVWTGTSSSCILTYTFVPAASGSHTLDFTADDSVHIVIKDASLTTIFDNNKTTDWKTVTSSNVTLTADQEYTLIATATDTGERKGVAFVLKKGNFVVLSSRSEAYSDFEVITRTTDIYDAYKAEDGGIDLETDVFAEGITDYYHAIAKAEELVRTSRTAFVIKLKNQLKDRYLEPGDIVKLNSDTLQLGTEIDLFLRVNEIKVNENGIADLTCSRFDSTQFTWSEKASALAKAPNQYDFEVAVPTNVVYSGDTFSYLDSSGKIIWDPVTSTNIAYHVVYMWTNHVETPVDLITGDLNWIEIGRTSGLQNYLTLPLLVVPSAIFGVKAVGTNGKMSDMGISSLTNTTQIIPVLTIDQIREILTNMASDGVITKSEKRQLYFVIQQLISEYNSAMEQNASYTLSAQPYAGTIVPDYIAAAVELSRYLAAPFNESTLDGVGLGGSDWSDPTTDSLVDGTTFYNTFDAVLVTHVAFVGLVALHISKMGQVMADAILGANAAISGIVSDSIIDASEKPMIVSIQAQIMSYQSELAARITASGYTIDRTDVDGAITALNTYLALSYASGGVGTGGTDWSDLTTNSEVNPTTFRSKFNDVFAAAIVIDMDLADGRILTGHAAFVSYVKGASLQIARVTDDNYLSRDEKPSISTIVNDINNYSTVISPQATALGITTELTDYTNAVSALNAYLAAVYNPGTGNGVGLGTTDWSNTSTDSSITGTIFRDKFDTVFELGSILEAKMFDITTATLDDIVSQLTAIGSDNMLTMGEKPQLKLIYDTLITRKDASSTEGTARGLTTEVSAVSTALTNLDTYLQGLGSSSTDWYNATLDTVVVGSTMSGYFNVFATKIGLLEKAIATYDRLALLDIQGALDDIASDNVLSAGEKPWLKMKFDEFTAWKTGSTTQGTARGLTTEVSNVNTKYGDLQTYLQGLGSSSTDWYNSSFDTVIVGSTLLTKIKDTADAILALDAAIANYDNATINDVWAQVNDLSSDNVLSTNEKTWFKARFDEFTTWKTNSTAQGTARGITTEVTTVNTTYGALQTYLQSLGSTSTDWYNPAFDTTMTGATLLTKITDTANALVSLDAKIQSYDQAYATEAHQALLNGISQANTALVGTAADSTLATYEKDTIKIIYDSIITWQTALAARITASGLTVSRTALDNAVSALTTYLQGLGPGGTAGWYNNTVDTTIVGSTFQTKFRDVFDAASVLDMTLAGYSTSSQVLAPLAAMARGVATAQLQGNTAITNAATAQADATTALSTLTDIASDAKLTPSEKSDIRQMWNIAVLDKASLNSQATSMGGSSTENTAYNSAFQTLATYLNNGTTWTTGIPSWISDANLSATTTIVGATFRTNWSNYYDARQALINAFDLRAKSLANTAQTTADAKLAASASDILAGAITVQNAGGIKTGTIAWNSTTGALTSGTGVAITEWGIIGAASGVATFSLNASTGAAIFSGSITGGANIDITGTATLNGSRTVGGNDYALVVNDSRNTNYGMLCYGSTVGGNAAYFYSSGSGHGIASLALGLGSGVYASSNTGSGLYATSTSGPSIECATSFKWGSKTYVVPNGHAYEFMTSNGTWASIGTIGSGAATATFNSTNKPGAATTNTWLAVNIGGTTYYVPAWT